MKQEPQIDKTIVTRAVIAKIETEKKPEKIKAKHIPGYPVPQNIRLEDKDRQFTPDITAIKDETTDVYEIELEEKIQLEKWRLFSRYAENHHGRLTLVVPNKYLDTIKRHVSDNAIIANFIYFDTG